MATIHRLVRKGDVEGVRNWLASTPEAESLVEEIDENGFTPLYEAVDASPANAEVVKLLLEAGADPAFAKVKTMPGWIKEVGEVMKLAEDAFPSEPYEYRQPLLRAALKAGNPVVVRLLYDYGADFTYHDENNYTAVLDAVYGNDENPDVLRFLIDLGLDVDAVSSYGESPLSVAAHLGRFTLLGELLAAGADEAPLKWTPLHRVISAGSIEDVMRALEQTEDLTTFDRWGRAPLHVALLKGDIEKVETLRRAGADFDQRAENGDASLSFATQGANLDLVRQILSTGSKAVDKEAALATAVEKGLHEVARLLLDAGADARPERKFGGSLFEDAPDRAMILLLHEYGADLSALDSAGRRRFLNLPENSLDGVSREEYLAGRHDHGETANPQNIGDPFRLAMIRAGWSAYWARNNYDDPPAFGCEVDEHRPPGVWCFDRFGQSTTLLPDGRTILIAGEHEDSYDPDFRIYNDVTVFDPDGTITLLGYPYDVFPPTDSHTATLYGNWIYIIGSIGYMGHREGPIPVYRLSLEDFRIERVETTGEVPGRIYKHRATLSPEGIIEIEGGKSISFPDSKEAVMPNKSTYRLDLTTLTWSRN